MTAPPSVAARLYNGNLRARQEEANSRDRKTGKEAPIAKGGMVTSVDSEGFKGNTGRALDGYHNHLALGGVPRGCN